MIHVRVQTDPSPLGMLTLASPVQCQLCTFPTRNIPCPIMLAFYLFFYRLVVPSVARLTLWWGHPSDVPITRGCPPPCWAPPPPPLLHWRLRTALASPRPDSTSPRALSEYSPLYVGWEGGRAWVGGRDTVVIVDIFTLDMY